MAACARCGTENPLHARFCLGCGAGLEGDAEASLGSRRTVTVLFSDLVGSTMLGERHDPELIRTVLARYFAAMAAVIRAHGGTVEKYIGDAIMAVFGLPRIHEDDALRAVRAAYGMREALSAFNTELSVARGLTLVARTGVATGEVVAGDPASGGTLVTGDVVNTAARIEAAADADSILLSESTWRLVREIAIVESVDPLAAKGKSRPVPVVRLLGLREPAPGVPARVGPGAPLVGRTTELARLDGLLAEVVAERAIRVVVLTGPAGAGKSRLVAEWTSRHTAEVRILHGRCLSYGEGITWWPLRGILHAAAGIVEEDDAPTARRKLLAILDGVPGREVISTRLATLLGLSDEPAPVEELHWAVRRVLERLAGNRPLVLVVEDIHWAERPLLDLLAHLAAHVEGAPLLVLCPARPEIRDRATEWGWEPRQVSWEPLDALGPGSMEALADAVAGAVDLPDRLRARAVALAEGNPLFLEELVRMLVEEGAMAGDDIALPPTIGALLAARLDALPAGERGTAQRASVVGRAFEAATVVALTPRIARTGVREAIAGLLRRELVLVDADDGSRVAAHASDAYRFRHILIRDAAYEGLTKTERAELHERFADWLETAAGDRLAEYQAILGHHLARAHAYRTELRESGPATRRLGERAAGHLGAAARAARARDDLGSTVELGLAAAALLGSDGGAAPWLRYELGAALLGLGRVDEALEWAESALAGALAESDLGWAARARLLRLEAKDEAGLVSMAERHEEREAAASEADASGDAHAMAEAWIRLSIQAWSDGSFQASGDLTDRAREQALRAGDSLLAARVEGDSLVSDLSGPMPASAVVRVAERAVARARAHPSERCWALASLAVAEAMLRSFAQARSHANEAIGIARELAMPSVVANLLVDLWWVEWLAGDAQAAEVAVRASIEGTGDSEWGTMARCRLAEQLVLDARLDEARATLDAVHHEVPPLLGPRLSGVRAVLRAAQGDRGAIDEIEQALAMVPAPYVNQRADLLLEAALVMDWLGDRDASRRYADDAIAVAEAKENHAFADRVRRFLAGVTD